MSKALILLCLLGVAACASQDQQTQGQKDAQDNIAWVAGTTLTVVAGVISR